jgi:hypothetical protein
MPVILATWEVENRRSWFEGSFGKKLGRLQSQSISRAWWYTPVTPDMWKRAKRIMV